MCGCFYTVQVKALGGVRPLDQLLRVRELDCTCCGAKATEFMLEEAKTRLRITRLNRRRDL